MPLPKGYEWNLPNNESWEQFATNLTSKFRNQSWGELATDRDVIEQEQTGFDPTANWEWQNQQQIGPQGQELPLGALGWKPNGEADYGTGLGGWWNKVTSRVKEAYNTGYEEGIKLSGLEEWAIAEQNRGKYGLAGEKIAQGEIKKAQEERRPETPFGAKAAGTAEAAKEVFSQALWSILGALGSVSVGTERVLGTAGYALADVLQGKNVDWQRNWNASHLAYSGIFDASIYEEMNRRIDAGIRPDLAAMEIQKEKEWTLWPELIGQVLLDPLNVVGVFTKAGKVKKLEKGVQAGYHSIENPVLRELVDQAGKLDEAAGYTKLDELVKSQQALPAIRAHADNILNAEGKLDEMSKAFKMSDLTTSGKISHLSNETSEVLMHVVNNSDPEFAVEVFRGMIKSVSKNTDEAAEGLATMLKFSDPVALMSTAGNDTTVLLSRMSQKYGDDWLKNLDKFKGDKSALIQNLLNKMDDVGQEMFPSVKKMLDAEDAVRKGGEISEDIRKLADRAKALPEYVKTATRFHEKAQKVIGPLNRMFAGLYMGWSPGYAFRNWSNNTLQIFIDEGIGALRGSADEAFEFTRELHGGEFTKLEAFGTVEGSLEGGKAVTGLTDIKSTIQKVKTETKLLGKEARGPGQILGAQAELNGAKHIVAKSYKDTFERGLSAMVKDLKPKLKQVGFTDELIDRLPTYIMQNKGDARAVINAMRADIQSGVINLFDDITRIDPAYKKTLDGFGKWDEYYKTVLQAPTREAANTAAQKIFDDLAQMGEFVYRDKKAVGDHIGAAMAQAVDQGDISYSSEQLFEYAREANSKAVEIARPFFDKASELARQQGLNVEELLPKDIYKSMIENWGKRASENNSRLINTVRNIRDVESRQGNFIEIWNKYPELFEGPPPKYLDKHVLMDRAWTVQKSKARLGYMLDRDEAVGKITQYLDNIKAAGGKVPPEWRKIIDDAHEAAKQYDNAMVGKDGAFIPDQTILPPGTHSTQIAAKARQYGIATATAQGAMTEDRHILNIINKYASPEGEKLYKSLDEIPLDVAEEAFKAKGGIKPIIATTPDIELTKATNIPRDQLPRGVSDRFAQEAQRLADELSGGQAGKRTAEGVIGTTNVSWYREAYQKGMRKPEIDKALDKIVLDKGRDKGVNVERVKELILDNFKYGDKASGTPPDLYVLKELGADNKTLQEALDNFNDITRQNLSLDEAIEASTPSGGLLHDPNKAYYDDAGNLIEPQIKRILPAPDDNGIPTIARAAYDQREKIAEMRAWVMDDVAKNFGKKQLVDKGAERGLQLAEKELMQKIAETRLVSSRVAQEMKNFTLLNYGEKRYWDIALAYLYPYHFWYTRTYANWFKRIATNPQVLAHYSRYKQNLANVHADMPDWWKNNINTNDLPGVNVENPLYFNLEATLWPLNGITGTDFNDPYKRVNWWTYSLDYMNKFGPSLWSPINILTGVALYDKEQDAAERWMGRFFPQSATIKALASRMGISNLETDPLVLAFQGGLDPYERRRAQRALAQMEQDVIGGKLPQFTREQIQDAAYTQEGPVWDEAVKRAVYGRSGSQIASYLFGVGFKGRTKEDMEIDKFYTDYSKMWAMRPNLTTQEFKDGMNQLKNKYPFMDTMLLSRRDSIERDAGLAYLVLTRIPPGQSSDFAKAAGIDPALFEKFFTDKGQIDKWNMADRTKFMGGIMTLAGTLEIPSDMTRNEWNRAKGAYNQMNEDAKKKFGTDILDMVDTYYQAKTKNYDLANAYLDKHPEVEQYLNWKSERVMGSPLLSSYYGGASVIEGYYRSQMYADIEKKLGEDIFDILREYNDLKTYGTAAEQKAFYRQNKARIKQYYAIKDEWGVVINQNVAQLSANIQEGQGAVLREDIDVTSPSQMGIMDVVNQEQMSYEDFQAIMPEHVMNLVNDYFRYGEPLTESTEKQLSRLAQELGYGSTDDLLQAIGTSMYQ